MGTVRVRFAPSPTGHLHVGGARTALFNWLLCRKLGGQFILRIEDTDVSRNIAGVEEKLLDSLGWLGIQWDEGPDIGGDCGPYRQSERRDRYEDAANTLLSSGNAYYAFDTTEELDLLRRKAAAAKTTFRYPRPEHPPTLAEVDRARAEGRPVVVRFKAPDKAVTIRDEILGEISFPSEQLDDFVIVKSSGWPTYHLAVVVDDADMEISHVLRAQEHLMNTPRHVLLQNALSYPVPKFAHVPLVLNINGSKMSKRDRHKVVRKAVRSLMEQKRWTRQDIASILSRDDDAFERWFEKKADIELDKTQLLKLADAAHVTIPEIDVHDFRVSGYLPEALVNFIALIGWSPGDDREKMTLEEMTEAFSLDRISKTAGRFDREKLLAMNTDWSQGLPPDRLLLGFRDFTRASGSTLGSLDDETALHLLEACRGFRTFMDVEEKAGVLFVADDQVQYDPGAVRKVLEKGEGRGYEILQELLSELDLDEWSADSLQEFLGDYCKKIGLKLKDVAQPVRVAVAGRAVSPAIFDTLVILGKDKTMNRIRRCLARKDAS